VSASISALIPELQPFARELVSAAGSAGLLPRITSTLRTYSEQQRLYDRYLQGLSPYPAAPPGSSAHEYGWAFDMVVTPLEALADVGRYWQALGGVWGGSIGDEVHFEYPGFTKPVSQSDSVPEWILNFASGFVPYFGGVQLATSVLGLIFPSMNQSELVDMVNNPFSHLHRWQQALQPAKKKFWARLGVTY